VVLSNFRPGTLESLGLGPDELRGANPGIVTVESSALGSSGPDSRTMGYGPLVRARAGLTSIWRDPGLPDGFCDAMTVYPDHTAGRAGAVAALALLMARERTGAGGAATIAQTEVMLHQFAPELARESIEPGTLRARGNHGEFDAPQGLYPCAGDDQWVAVAIRGDDDWARLCEAVDAPDLGARPGLASAEGRVGTREEIDGRLAAWTSEHSHSEVTARLQAVGVPAGSMLRPAELLEDAHLAARRFFATLDQPQIGPIPAEAGPARFERMPAAAQHPAPLQGEHTRTVARQVLGLSDDEIDRLVADGTLEEWVPDQPAAAITPRSDGGAR
jgi:crotonobetainyl-CoA:carnitine CoA-transferase CaiB-like acyl-CoA transferase